MIYELIQPSDDITFEAASDEIAALVALYFGTAYGAKRGGWRFGPYLLDSKRAMPDFLEEFRVDAETSMKARLPELADAFASMRIGSRDEYPADEAGIDAMLEQRRTSTNNVSGHARMIAKAIREQIKKTPKTLSHLKNNTGKEVNN